MPRQMMPPYQIDDAEFIFKPNFKGEKTQYSAEGDRFFNLRLRPADAAVLQEDGWNVRTLEPREEGDELTYYLKVAVSFAHRAPNITLVGNITGRFHRLGEDLVSMVDYADIVKMDVVLSPYPWDVNGKQGIKAYLKTAYITIFEDPLDVKYGQMARKAIEGDGIIDAEILGPMDALEG